MSILLPSEVGAYAIPHNGLAIEQNRMLGEMGSDGRRMMLRRLQFCEDVSSEIAIFRNPLTLDPVRPATKCFAARERGIYDS